MHKLSPKPTVKGNFARHAKYSLVNLRLYPVISCGDAQQLIKPSTAEVRFSCMYLTLAQIIENLNYAA